MNMVGRREAHTSESVYFLQTHYRKSGRRLSGWRWPVLPAQNSHKKLDMVVHTCKASAREAEAGGSTGLPGQPA